MTSKLKIKIEGLNLNKIINEIISSGICIENLIIKSRCILFKIQEKEIKNIDLICRKYHKNYKIIQNSIKKRIIQNLPKCYGFLLAIIISFAFLFSHNKFVFDVNVSYESVLPYDLTLVKSVLGDAGIVSGIERKNVNVNDIQNLVLTGVNDISGCTVKRNGGSIDIVVFPSANKSGINDEDVVSKYTGVITEIEVFSGEANVKVGDIVKPGDVLIKNNNGASGKVMAKVYFGDYILYNENQTVKEFTGKEIECFSVSLFNKSLYKSALNNDFASFEEENCVFWLSKNTLIPVLYIKTKYKETILKDVFVPFDEQEEILKENLKRSVMEKAFGFDVKDITFSVVREENFVRVDCSCECLVDLAVLWYKNFLFDFIYFLLKF